MFFYVVFSFVDNVWLYLERSNKSPVVIANLRETHDYNGDINGVKDAWARALCQSIVDHCAGRYGLSSITCYLICFAFICNLNDMHDVRISSWRAIRIVFKSVGYVILRSTTALRSALVLLMLDIASTYIMYTFQSSDLIIAIGMMYLFILLATMLDGELYRKNFIILSRVQNLFTAIIIVYCLARSYFLLMG